jgi:hypothetical protein
MVYRNGFQPPDAVSHHHGLASEDSDVLTRNKTTLTSETPLVFSLSLSLSTILHDSAHCPECKKKDFADYGWILRALIWRFIHECSSFTWFILVSV